MELVEPFLHDVDLALHRASVNLFQLMRHGLDQTCVCQGLEKHLTGEINDLMVGAILVDGEEFDDAIGDFS